MPEKKKFHTIDEYIATFQEADQAILKEMRNIIHTIAPQATETINYGIPTYKLKGNLVHFGMAKNHIGFYPGSEAIVHFEKELEAFNTSKGTIQFPNDKKLPKKLIEKIVRFRIESSATANKK